MTIFMYNIHSYILMGIFDFVVLFAAIIIIFGTNKKIEYDNESIKLLNPDGKEQTFKIMDIEKFNIKHTVEFGNTSYTDGPNNIHTFEYNIINNKNELMEFNVLFYHKEDIYKLASHLQTINSNIQVDLSILEDNVFLKTVKRK